MSVSGVGGFEEDRLRLGLPDEIDDVREVDVVVMRPGVVAPAQVHPQLIGRDVPDGVVQRLDVHGGAAPELGDVHVGIGRMPAHGQIRAVQLEGDASRRDGCILVAHRVGDCEDVLLVGGVELVAEEQRRDTR